MPLYICANSCPPKSVIYIIEKIFRDCLWMDNENNHRFHWISWAKCCKPKGCGGLGFKGLHDIIHIQSLKLCWKVFSEDTLWTEFLKIKYSKDLNGGNQLSKSGVWRRIGKHLEEARNFITVINQQCTWNLSTDGKFSTKNTWKEIKDGHTYNTVFAFIWNKFTPKKISLFMWKLLHNKLPTDENIQRIGISVASKCNCCDVNKVESINHLMIRSQVANKVWDYFNRKVGLRSSRNEIDTWLKYWWFQTKISSKDSAIFHALPSFVCWEVWKSRCKARYEDKKMNSQNVINAVRGHITNMVKLKLKLKINDDITKKLTDL